MFDLDNVPDSELDQVLATLRQLVIKSPLDYIPHPANPLTGFPGMEEFHCSNKRIRLLFGGNQSGKTIAGANELLFCTTGLYPTWYPKENRINHAVKARIVGEEYKNWGRVIENKLLEFLPADLIVKKQKTMKGSLEYLEVRHVSGEVSQIEIMTHEQDVAVFESWTGDFVWFDEPPPQDKWVATSRGLMAQNGRAIFTMTPLKEPWLHDQFILNKDELHQVWYCAMDDNPYLTQDQKNFFIAQMSEDEKDARKFGKSKHLAGRVYKEFDEVIHVVSKDKVKIQKDYPVYFVCDPHDRKPHYAIWARINPNGVIYVVDEIKFKGTIKEFSKQVRLREALAKINSDDVVRVGDPNKMVTPSAMNGRTFQEEFCGDENPYKLYFNVNVNDDITLGHLAVAGRLNWDKSKPISSTNCPKLYFIKENTSECIKEMLTYVWDDWRGTAKDAKGLKELPKDRNKDFPDCVRYLVAFNPAYFVGNESDPVVANSGSVTGYSQLSPKPQGHGDGPLRFTRF